MRMVEEWVYTGTVTDPYDEFMVYEDTKYNRESLQTTEYDDTYWERRYTLKDNPHVPVFLQHVALVFAFCKCSIRG